LQGIGLRDAYESFYKLSIVNGGNHRIVVLSPFRHPDDLDEIERRSKSKRDSITEESRVQTLTTGTDRAWIVWVYQETDRVMKASDRQMHAQFSIDGATHSMKQLH
jgi:hypothetical protein